MNTACNLKTKIFQKKTFPNEYTDEFSEPKYSIEDLSTSVWASDSEM